jgi:hypothetical protein
MGRRLPVCFVSGRTALRACGREGGVGVGVEDDAGKQEGSALCKVCATTTYSGPSCLRLRSFFFRIHSRDLTVGRVCFLPKKDDLVQCGDTEGAMCNAAGVYYAYPSFRSGRASRSERIWRPPLPVLLLRPSWPAEHGPRRLQRGTKISCGRRGGKCEGGGGGGSRQPPEGKRRKSLTFWPVYCSGSQ